MKLNNSSLDSSLSVVLVLSYADHFFLKLYNYHRDTFFCVQNSKINCHISKFKKFQFLIMNLPLKSKHFENGLKKPR